MTGHKLQRYAPQATQSNGRQPRWLSRLLLLTCTALCAALVHAVHPYDRWAGELGIDMNASYDGTRVMEIQEGQFEMLERRAPGKVYTEMVLGNMTAGVILREDLGKSYTLMPSMGFYRELSLDDGMMQASNGLEFSEIEKVGTETVAGHSSTRYKTRFADKNGEGEGFIWVTDTGVPIKMDMTYSNRTEQGQHVTMQFTELNLRPQDPAYFEVPANLEPMTMGAGMANLGQLLGMAADSAPTDARGSAPASSPDSTGGTTDAIQSVTDSVTEGTKGLISGIGGLFGMGGDDPKETPRETASASAQLSSDNLTQSVQLHLEALGYDPGNTDGEASMQTSIAISQFQAEKGLEVTGEVTPQLAGVLEAEVDH